MPFDPEKYLAKKQAETAVGGSPKEFDPKAFLASKGVQSPISLIQEKRNAGMSDTGMAFSQSLLDAAMPLTRYADALARKSENPQRPLSMSQALDEANADAETRKSLSPNASMFGTGVGLAAGGLLGGLATEAASAVASPFLKQGLTRLTAEKTAEAAAKGIADLAGLAFEGGAMSVLIDQPKSFEDALHSFSAGATIAGALGLGLKGTSHVLGATKRSAGNALEELDNKLTASAKAKHEVDIQQSEKNASLKSSQVNRAEEMLQRRQAELDLTRSQQDKVKALIEQEPFINDRVANLPGRIDQLMDQGLQQIGSKKSTIVQQIAEQRVDPTNHFKNTLDELNSINPKTLTPQAESARQQAISYIEQLDQRMFDSMSPTDSLIGISKTRDTNIGTLDTVHDQIQSLIFDRGFLQNAPKGSPINKITQKFERNLRQTLNAADPTGELAVYNEAYHNLKNAKELDALSLDNPRFFMQKAVDPNNPALLKRYNDFESHLKTEFEGGNFRQPKQSDVNPLVSKNFSEKNTSEFGAKLATSVFDKRLGASQQQFNSAKNAYKEVSNQFKAIRDLINAEAEPAMMDYAVLQKHKPQLPTLENKALSLEQAIENNKSSVETRKLAAENANLAVADKIAETPANSLEALMPAKLRLALKFRRSVDENAALIGQAKNSISQSAPVEYGRIGLEALSRGLATRGPGMSGFTKSQSDYEISPDNSIIGNRALQEIK